MNVGIVTTWFERGAAYVSRAYMDTLERQGFNVFVYARGGEDYAVGDPVWDLPNVTWSPRYHGLLKCSLNYVNPSHLCGWAIENDIQIVLFNEERTFRTVAWLNRHGICTGAYVDYYTPKTVERFNTYDFLLCNTRRHYSVFERFEDTIYIPWGTDTNLFRPQESFSGEIHRVTFFHSAGYGSRKGTDLLVRAFRRVHGDCRLIVHSQVPLLRLPTEIRDDIEKDTRITVIDRTVSAPGLYHLGHVYVYPSRLDGIGLTIAEALSAGLPVITTDSAPMNEFVEDGYNGCLVDVARSYPRSDGYYWPITEVSTDDLAATMQRFVDSPSMLAEYRVNARRSAEDRLDWFANSANLGQQLRRVFDKKCGAPRRVSRVDNCRRALKDLYWRCESSLMAAHRYMTSPLRDWIKSTAIVSRRRR